MNWKQILFGMLLLVFFAAPVIVAAKININTASVEELDTLPGVGTTTAAKIIAARPFTTIEDLRKVSGFGGEGKNFDKVKDLITVGENPPDSNVQDGNGDDGGDLATTTDSGVSTHSSPAELSGLLEEKSTLSVSAGRDRLIATGSRNLFRAVAKGLKDGGANADFYWNFGDGTAARGPGLYHTYRYPGTYNVVLTLTQGENEAVSRIAAKVIDPKIKLQPKESEFGESMVEIKNLAAEEVNLGEWRLVNNKERFVLPADTIISKGSSLVIPFSAAGSVKLVAPSEQVFAQNVFLAGGDSWQNLRESLERLAAVSSNVNQAAGPVLVAIPSPVAVLRQPIIIATSSSIELPAKQSWWSWLVDKIF